MALRAWSSVAGSPWSRNAVFPMRRNASSSNASWAASSPASSSPRSCACVPGSSRSRASPRVRRDPSLTGPGACRTRPRPRRRSSRRGRPPLEVREERLAERLEPCSAALDAASGRGPPPRRSPAVSRSWRAGAPPSSRSGRRGRSCSCRSARPGLRSRGLRALHGREPGGRVQDRAPAAEAVLHAAYVVGGLLASCGLIT